MFDLNGPGMNDLRHFWTPFKFVSNCMVSVVNHMNKWDHTEIIRFVFENPRNNFISDMPVLFQ